MNLTPENANDAPAAPVANESSAPLLLDQREASPWGMIDKFEEAFGKGTLNLLPDHPRFVFCATDMAFGATRGPKDR